LIAINTDTTKFYSTMLDDIESVLNKVGIPSNTGTTKFYSTMYVG